MRFKRYRDMLDEYDPGLPMMVAFLVGLFITILWIDLQPGRQLALSVVSLFGFYIVLSVISFRYHCVAKDAIVSDKTPEEDDPNPEL